MIQTLLTIENSEFADYLLHSSTRCLYMFYFLCNVLGDELQKPH